MKEWQKGFWAIAIGLAVFAVVYQVVIAIAEADGLITNQGDTQLCVLIFSSVMAVISAMLSLTFFDFIVRRNIAQKGG